jgi:hypothetical protein
MSIAMLAALALALGLAGAAQVRDTAAPGVGSGQIHGRIVLADSGEPLRKVRVSLQSGQPVDPVFTDANGAFTFAHLAPGRYTLAAAHTGYYMAAGGPSTPALTVTVANAAVATVSVPMRRTGAIAGRILDDLGEPVVGARVAVQRFAWTNGRRQPVGVSREVETNDLGEYRIGGLRAGSYYVHAVPDPVYPTPETTTSRGTLRAAPTYFPGTADESQAQAVPVRDGADAGSIDFVMTMARVATVSGTVADPQGNPVTGTYLAMSIDGANNRPAVATNLRPGGAFSIRLDPGDYVLLAQGSRGSPGVASTLLTVDGADITGLQLGLVKGARVSGQVVTEDGARPPLGTLEIFPAYPNNDRPHGIPVSSPNPSLSPVRVKADGTFELMSLVGPRELRVQGVPPGWAVKGIRAGDRDLLDASIDFAGTEQLTDVRVVLTNHLTAVSGLVNPGGAFDANVSVVVFPDDRSRLQHVDRWARLAPLDQDSRFSVTGLPQGSYLAVAVRNVDDAEWSNPEYLDGLRSRGVPFALGDGEQKTLDLTAVVDR